MSGLWMRGQEKRPSRLFMFPSRRTVFLIAVGITLSGCATMMRGTSETFTVETRPPEANVRLSTGETCITPCALQRGRNAGFVVYVSKQGYKSMEIPIASQRAQGGTVATMGNVLMGGLIGFAVDVDSGATQELKPNPLKIDLILENPSDD